MRIFVSVLIDLLLLSIGTVTAAVLRDNFDFSTTRLAGVALYLIITALVGAVLLPLSGVNRAIWRFSSMPDYVRLAVTLAAIISCSVALTFAINRLNDIPRSLPFLQFYVSITFIVGARVIYRLHHAARRSRRQPMAPLNVIDEPVTETLLLVGLSQLTETYLRSAVELAPDKIQIAGILGSRDRHVGRLVAAHKVLGLPEDIDRVLSDLEITGVSISRIVVTAPTSALSPNALDAIDAIEQCGSIEVQYLSRDLRFEPRAQDWSHIAARSAEPAMDAPVKFEIRTDEIELMRGRGYWRIKRFVDVTGSLCLLVATAPLQILVGLTVAATISRHIVFGQQRPGLGGRPFRLHKFRTMGVAYAADGRRLSDEERVSRVGNFLRRTRLDELPQLFNILLGDMSFIGPRPLLPRDQDKAYSARLLVRPGLTGWAQVVGGRTISAQDKAALDVWYVRNASLSLDIAIVVRTIPIVFMGETVSDPLIHRAWQELAKAGVLKVKGGLAAADLLRSSQTQAYRNA